MQGHAHAGPYGQHQFNKSIQSIYSYCVTPAVGVMGEATWMSFFLIRFRFVAVKSLIRWCGRVGNHRTVAQNGTKPCRGRRWEVKSFYEVTYSITNLPECNSLNLHLRAAVVRNKKKEKKTKIYFFFYGFRQMGAKEEKFEKKLCCLSSMPFYVLS